MKSDHGEEPWAGTEQQLNQVRHPITATTAWAWWHILSARSHKQPASICRTVSFGCDVQEPTPQTHVYDCGLGEGISITCEQLQEHSLTFVGIH